MTRDLSSPRVLHIVWNLIRGGTEGQCARAVLSLKTLGLQGRVAAFRREGFFLEALEKEVGPVYHLSIAKLISWKTIREVWKLQKYIRDQGIDVVHTWDADAAIFGSIAAWLSGRPLITSRRDMGEIYPQWKVRALHRADRRASRVVANARAIKDRFASCGLPAEKIEVITNLFDLDDFDMRAQQPFSRLAELPDGIRLVMVARLDPEKDTGVIIEALAPVVEKRPDVRLVIAGDGREREALEALVKARGMTGHVCFLGDIKEVPALLAVCDIGLLVPRSNEGLSNSILEYRAAGLPVIATDCGGNAELIEHGRDGTLIPIGDRVALTSAIFQWLDKLHAGNSSEWKNRDKLKAEHAPQVVAGKFADLYRRVLRS